MVEYSEGYKRQAKKRLKQLEQSMTPHARMVAEQLSEHFQHATSKADTMAETFTIEQRARLAVDGIIDDLTDRRGLSGEWYNIDEDIRNEIIETWVDIVCANYKKVSE
jgi:hypothetical protein